MADESPGYAALFSPDSLAGGGASPDSWYTSRLMDTLLEYGFDGDVYPVNPGRDTAWDRDCYDSLSELPAPVDLAVVSVPREYVVDTVREAGDLGIPAALVITAGFAEADAEGERLEAEFGAVVDEHEIDVCGPDCIGLANALEGTVLTSTCSRVPEPGSIGLVSQSGALAFTTFFGRAADASTSRTWSRRATRSTSRSPTTWTGWPTGPRSTWSARTSRASWSRPGSCAWGR